MSKRERNIALLVGIIVGGALLDRTVEGMLNTRQQRLEEKALAEKALADDQKAMQNRSKNEKFLENLKSTSLQRIASDSEGQMLDRLLDCIQQAGINPAGVMYRPPNSSPVKVGNKPNSKEQFMKQIAHMTVPGNMEQVARFAYYVNNSEIPMRITEIQISPTKEATNDFKVEFGISTIYLTQQATEPARQVTQAQPPTSRGSSTSTQQGRSNQQTGARSGQSTGTSTRPALQAGGTNTTRPAATNTVSRGTGGTPTTRTESVQ